MQKARSLIGTDLSLFWLDWAKSGDKHKNVCPHETHISTLWSFRSVTTAKEAEPAIVLKISGNRSSRAENKSPVASTRLWYAVHMRWWDECKPLCITLNNNYYEGGKLVSLPTDHELSWGENNPKLPELSVINGCYILPTHHRLQETQTSTEWPMNK